ncbi:probable E3 ubiquitin-protein ligase ARI5 [Poecilia formosa]|nr:PREDICTED: probable E3 ubiquitin-protein ligase ARI5 [Poecilia formosa]
MLRVEKQSSYAITTTGQEENRCSQRKSRLKFVNRPDDLNPFDDGEQGPPVELSCGHAASPQSINDFCSNLLKKGQYKFKCPALKKGTLKCDTLLPCREVRRMVGLAAKQQYEKETAYLTAEEHCDFKKCPGCSSYVEREDLTNLCVQCLVCSADQKKEVLFCWQCLKLWKGPAPRSDRCDNDGCKNHDLELLRTCETTSFYLVQGVENCPSIRACPTCGHKVEHDKTGCKNITCPRCQVEFCFVCLKLTPECLKTSSYFIPCSDGVAPRQTAIPVWHRK